ncbi:MAG: GHMP kinase [Alphaproteobacteria bacterium]|nr:GHMP kinase [Alphaproteobacteria bacterium]
MAARKPAASGREIRVVAPARLHLGFLDLNGGLGRKFGSLGLAIDHPVTRLSLARAEKNSIEGFESSRADKALGRLKAQLGVEGNFRLKVEEAIPAHAGLGSGTQLALSIGAALSELEGLEAEFRRLGEMQARGARSAIGMAAFERGGFVVDGGRGALERAPPVVAQADIPSHWRVLLALDPARVGVHGDSEVAAFETLPEMSAAVSGELSRIMLMQLLPGLIEDDIETFGAAVTRVQEINGEYFASEQGGGIWASTGVAAIVRRMADLGAVGIGQSSWGPTGFAFAPTSEAAARIRQQILAEAGDLGLEVIIARGRNHGATTEVLETRNNARAGGPTQ